MPHLPICLHPVFFGTHMWNLPSSHFDDIFTMSKFVQIHFFVQWSILVRNLVFFNDANIVNPKVMRKNLLINASCWNNMWNMVKNVTWHFFRYKTRRKTCHFFVILWLINSFYILRYSISFTGNCGQTR